MTKKESAAALALYKEIKNVLYFHSKNLTKKQYFVLDNIREYLREISTKAYKERIKQWKN